MVEIPGVTSRRKGQILWLCDLFIPIFVLIVGAMTASRFYDEGKWWRFVLSLVATIGVAILSIVKAAINRAALARQDSVHDLEGCLHTLLSLLRDCCADPDAAKLRLTVHRPIDGGKALEQVLGYVGDHRELSQSAGRRFPSQSGIIGVALREMKATYATRANDDYEAYLEELISTWHFTRQDAQAKDQASKSWMAVPLILEESGKKEVKGVIFADSVLPNFFDEDKLYLTVVAASGIARFVQGRYK